MAPTKRKTTRKATTTKHKPETTKVGEEVLDLVIPYIHNLDDRNSISLVSRKFYETDGITRKRVTVHTLYSNPSRLGKRFPFIESLTLKGPPWDFNVRDDYDTRITPWIQQLALEFRCLKELYIRGLVVHDEDLKKLARTHGKDLRSLKIKKCIGFSTDGLTHVSKHCNQLRTLCLDFYYIEVKDGIWIHQLALNSTVLERLHLTNMDISHAEDLTLLAKNCCNSLISLKIGNCYLSKLGDAFRYAVRLEHFGGDICDEESELVNFQLPLNMRSLSGIKLSITQYSSVLPLLNQITKLKLFGHVGFATGRGLIALSKGCTNLEHLKVSIGDISNEALECVGTHLKNLRDFRIWYTWEEGISDLPLDNGVRAMLMGCNKLKRLDISLWYEGLTDVGLEYIGKYGANLRSLSLSHIGKSNAGLVKLSEGCPKLRKLKLGGCSFCEQVVTCSVFNIPSLRYARFDSSERTVLALTRPEFQL